jgi:hypothetical protein
MDTTTKDVSAESASNTAPIQRPSLGIDTEHEIVLRLAEETDAVDIATIWRDCLGMHGGQKSVPDQEQAIAAFKERIRQPKRALY